MITPIITNVEIPNGTSTADVRRLRLALRARADRWTRSLGNPTNTATTTDKETGNEPNRD